MKKIILALLLIITLILAALTPHTVLAATTWDIADGSTLDFTNRKLTNQYGGVQMWPEDQPPYNNGTTINIKAGPLGVTLIGDPQAAVKITCEEGVTLTIEDLFINVSEIDDACALTFTGAGNMLVSKGNSLFASGYSQPGIKVVAGTSLEISAPANTLNSLYATSGLLAAGIGGGFSTSSHNAGDITISGYANVTAEGNYDSAGIGGSKGDGGNIIITDHAVVTAIGGSSDGGWCGAGIGGGGYYGSGGSITISGYSHVTATGGKNAAGIGGGGADVGGGNGGNIMITDHADVTATGGGNAAGIGGGNKGGGGNITISGDADVTAKGGSYASGIGGGSRGGGGTIKISGGTVTATGGKEGAGIGSGSSDDDNPGINGGTIQISGGTIKAYGGGGDDTTEGNVGAGIGGGYYCSGGNITISGDADVVAKGGRFSAGIGGGSHNIGGEINIKGGTVDARGGQRGAGIGGGYDGSGGVINIRGGTVDAIGGEWSAGIGGGHLGDSGSISIEGGRVVATGGDVGVGIGGGNAATGGSVTISGGTVFAQRGYQEVRDIGMTASLSLIGDAMVFLLNDSCIAPEKLTLTHFNSQYAVDYQIYGIDMPTGWNYAAVYAYSYQMTYDDNGGTGEKQLLWPKGVSMTIGNSSGFSKPGYTFVKWNTQANGSGVSYYSGDSIVMDANKTLYAIWESVAVTGVDITSDVKILSPGGIAALTANVTPNGAADKSLTWTSDNTSVAKVDSRGVVTAVGPGSALITAKSISNPSYYDTCQIAVSSVLLNYALSTGSTMEMTAAVSPSDNTATWTSDNTGVAEVGADGKVTAKAPGLAMITVTAGGVSQTVGVAVYDQTVTSVALNRTSVDLTVGGSLGLTAYVDPDDAVNKNVTWTSDDENVATVSDGGTVTAVGKGSTMIRAQSGGQSASCRVEVKLPVASVSIGDASKILSLNETADLNATVSPGDATDTDVKWTSSDESIVTVDASGTVTAVGFGSTTVIAEADGKYDTCTVSVVKTDVTGVMLSNTSRTLKKGGTAMLSATVLPGDATYPDVTWTSSNESIATVDANGTVTAKNFGSATITAEADGITAVCTVSVVETDVTAVSLDSTSETMAVGDTAALSATVAPDNATDSSVTWKSSDISVATVDQSGKVTAVGEGVAAITAEAGGKFAVCAVLVASKDDAMPSPAATDGAGNEGATPTPRVEKIIITIVVGDLPEGTTSVRLPSGEVVELDGSDTIQVEIDKEGVSEDGSVEIVPLDDEGTPLGEYTADVQAITIPDAGSAWGRIWPVLMWVLIGIAGAGAAGLAAYLLLRKRRGV